MYKFSDVTHEADVEVSIDTQFILKIGSFKYFGTVIQGNEEIDDDFTHRIGARWMTGRMSSVINMCHQDLKVIYFEKEKKWLLDQQCCTGRSVGRTNPPRPVDESCGNEKLRSMCGHTRKDRIRN